jgi:AraC family transcriptional regulator of adaptative response/methylated-DNA-[protein]-cysteine methyltransferase
MTDEQMWEAFNTKSAHYDGKFYVAVRTTGVYCRPSCPAKPLRKNVAFFATCDAAELAGYRPCKRCHPRDTLLPAENLAESAVKWIETHGRARLSEMSEALHVSPFHLQRTFKRVVGVSPLDYAKTVRIEKMKGELGQDKSTTTAIYDAGFNSSSQAYESVSGIGMTPRIYKKGGLGEKIAYTITDTALGRMLIAGTARGICAAYFGDSDTELERSLQKEYPQAHIERHIQSDLADWAMSVAKYVDGQLPHISLQKLPIDVKGTAFQSKVWQALRQIPTGQTRSYSEIAQSIGMPTATRAVANACGANRLAVIIPCHRVVREGGKLGGYRWGNSRKKQLLDYELGASVLKQS